MKKGPITIATAQVRISADGRANSEEIRSLMRQEGTRDRKGQFVARRRVSDGRWN
jgi:hypothetical protein